MNDEQKNTIQEYIVIFKNLLAPYLKPSVAVATTVYPYTSGVVLLFQFNFEANTETLFEKEEYNLNEVIEKYQLDIDGLSTDELQRGHSIIFRGRSILSVKGYNPDQWNEERARSIVNNIVTIIREKIHR